MMRCVATRSINHFNQLTPTQQKRETLFDFCGHKTTTSNETKPNEPHPQLVYRQHEAGTLLRQTHTQSPQMDFKTIFILFVCNTEIDVSECGEHINSSSGNSGTNEINNLIVTASPAALYKAITFGHSTSPVIPFRESVVCWLPWQNDFEEAENKYKPLSCL